MAWSVGALLLGVSFTYRAVTYEPVDDLSRVVAGDSVLLKPGEWVGRDFPLIPHIDVGDQLAEGHWVVVLYRYDCGHCVRSMSGYVRQSRELAASAQGGKVALIQIPPQGPVPMPGDVLSDPSFQIVLGGLRDDVGWFGLVPVELRLDSGVVVEVAEGSGG